MFQDDLDSFLTIAGELQLKGLIGNSEDGFGDSNSVEKYTSEQSVSNTINETVSQKLSPKPENQTKFGGWGSLALPVNSSLAIPGNLSVGLVELDERVKLMMEKTQNNLGNGRGFAYLCKVCGKEGHKKDLRDHIEANHLEGVIIPCNFCEKTFRCKNSVRMHIKRQHKN